MHDFPQTEDEQQQYFRQKPVTPLCFSVVYDITECQSGRWAQCQVLHKTQISFKTGAVSHKVWMNQTVLEWICISVQSVWEDGRVGQEAALVESQTDVNRNQEVEQVVIDTERLHER